MAMFTTDDVCRGDSFEDATFAGLDLTDADLGGKSFTGCTFRNLKLSQTRWDGARLEDCILETCDLTRLLPAGMGLRGVRFERCKMMGIDWSNIGPYPDLAFADCNLDYCSFLSLRARKVPFARCSLVEATFVDCDLTEARFTECTFTGARFERCDLRKANFGGAQALALDPASNQVKGASIPLEAARLLAMSFGFKVTDL